MAFFPCDVASHRHKFRNTSMYVRVSDGELFHPYLSRICPSHWELVHDNLAQFEVDPTGDTRDGFNMPTQCFSCGQPVDQFGRQVFITSYPAQNEREDYWLKIHPDCSLPPYFTMREWERKLP